jgi:hypothetical protein
MKSIWDLKLDFPMITAMIAFQRLENKVFEMEADLENQRNKHSLRGMSKIWNIPAQVGHASLVQICDLLIGLPDWLWLAEMIRSIHVQFDSIGAFICIFIRNSALPQISLWKTIHCRASAKSFLFCNMPGYCTYEMCIGKYLGGCGTRGIRVANFKQSCRGGRHPDAMSVFHTYGPHTARGPSQSGGNVERDARTAAVRVGQ